MSPLTIFLIALGLSFDTFAVSVSNGLSISNIHFRQAIGIAMVLAVFQAGMPVVGWIAGLQVEHLIRNYDHWIAFGLLLILGVRMIIESFKEPDAGKKRIDRLSTFLLIGMATATSIDALVVGITFAFSEVNILLSVIIIGAITFLAAMLGMLFGKKVGERTGNRVEIIGGLILIGIGVKILVSHLTSIPG